MISPISGANVCSSGSDSAAWSAFASVNSPRAHATANAISGGKILVAGGTESDRVGPSA
jgi:hypothetical protein